MKYTFVPQLDATDCAAACLAMVCLHYKKETTITKLRDIMGTDLKGTNMIGLTKGAEQLGFQSQAVRVDKEGFQSRYTLPCIANIITKEGMSHFVVVFRIGKKHVVIGDPAKDLIRIPLEDFFKEFTGVLLILKPSQKFQKESFKDKGLLARYIGLLLPQKKLFIYSILASIILTVLGIVSSAFNKILMDEILPYKLKHVLVMMLIVFTVITVTQTVIGFIRQWIMLYLSQKIDIPLILGYFEHIYKLPMKFFAVRKTGDIITRFSDVFTIKNIITNIVLTLVMDITMALVTGTILFRMNVSLFVIILFMTVLSILLVFIFKQPYKEINMEQMQQSSILNSQIIEGLRGVESIKSNAGEENELEQIEREYIRALRISFKEGMLSNIQGLISGILSGVGNMILTYAAILQVINGNITLGSMMAFMTLSGYFMNPVQSLVGLQLQIQEANISLKRLAEIMDYEQEQGPECTSEQTLEIEGDVEIRNLTFRYGNRKPVLRNISFQIPEGKKVALVGASGSGKSTITKLLLKYYEPEEGTILINGVDMNDYTSQEVRRAISYVPQNVELYSKSIYDNIRIGRRDATLDEVKKAAKEADAHDFIRKLPLQYHTYLEEAGNGLIGGEKQRIALSRAFLKDSGLYILDESTSSLDFATENLIFDVLYNKLEKKTMLIIAHRLATIKHCDLILVLDEGQIMEKGTHEELLAAKGKYYELWEMQQGNFKRKEVLSADTVGLSDINILDTDGEMSYT